MMVRLGRLFQRKIVEGLWLGVVEDLKATSNDMASFAWPFTKPMNSIDGVVCR
jgi:hypothetical protein